MSDQPYFTVIIPTYNRRRFLGEAIRSVLSQTFTDWELIVIDDGSRQPLEDIVRGFVDQRINYVYQENGGLGYVRQRGMDLARGTFVCFLDDDDYYLPDHLHTMYQAIEGAASQQALFKSGIIHLDTRGRRQKSVLYDSHKQPLEQHWKHADNILPYAIPKEAGPRIPSYQYYFSEDFNWLGRLLLHYPLVQIEAHSVVYRWHDENRTAVITDRNVLYSRMDAVRDLYETPGMANCIRRKSFQHMMVHQALHYCRTCIKARKYAQAMFGFRKALPYFRLQSTRELVYTLYVLVRQIFVLHGRQKAAIEGPSREKL